MLRATKNIMLPTTITGSLPRPSWYTQNLGSRSFLDAMVNNQFREQYVDAVSIYLHEQEMATTTRSRRRPAKVALDFRRATFFTTISNHGSCRVSAVQSRAASCNTPPCSRSRSG